MRHILKIKEIIYVALMAVIICICSWITIPFAVPFTMQTFAVFCALLLLGGRRGTAAIGLYLFMGLIGLPVFSGFSGGIGHLIGPTGGYIIGFLFSGIIYTLSEPFISKRKAFRLIVLALAHMVCYLIGTLWFVVVSGTQNATYTFTGAVSLCVLPFIIPDCIKMALAVVLCDRIKRAVDL